MKTCSTCKTEKPTDAFSHHAGRKDGFNNVCRACRSTGRRTTEARAVARVQQKSWRTKNPARAKSHVMKSLYGITIEQYDAMLAAQGGVCALCQKAAGRKRLVIDHDHATGKVRGLLHDTCNAGLGHFHDDVEKLSRAIAYLQRASACL